MPTELPIHITQQGKPRINDAVIEYDGEMVKAVAIDCASKRCSIVGGGSADGIPMVMVCATDESLHLDHTQDFEETTIEFPALKGWDVWCCNEFTRYCAYVCFVNTANRD